MDKLYYISQGKSLESHLLNIEKVCEAGCRLVQLRLKEVTQDEYNKTAAKAKSICDRFGATLIVNDNIEAAIASGAHGIHLGKNDRSPVEARVLAEGKIIGGTANTLDDCLRLVAAEVDYIGLGPFRFTETKKGLDPIVGLEGFQKIQQAMNSRGLSIPIYAIGGIQIEDMKSIMDAEIHGVSVSGLLTDKSDLKERINQIQNVL